jgi:hypothetical protein
VPHLAATARVAWAGRSGAAPRFRQGVVEQQLTAAVVAGPGRWRLWAAAPRVDLSHGHHQPRRRACGPRRWLPASLPSGTASSRLSAPAPVVDETLTACPRLSTTVPEDGGAYSTSGDLNGATPHAVTLLHDGDGPAPIP